ncbi:MAG: hypothetical protein U9O54_06530, partial [Chloroflexota bacterium]|nr:hypothetical protein [Chloroflexota bacterium]
MNIQDFLDSITADINSLRELLLSWVIAFMGWRRSDKVLGVIRRWALILSLAILWAVYAFYIAIGQEVVHLQIQSLRTYMNFPIYVLASETFPMEIEHQNYPTHALIIKDEQDPEQNLKISLAKKDLFQGTLEEWFYRYQILITETASIQKIKEIPGGGDTDSEDIPKEKTIGTVDPNTIILFGPEYIGNPFRWLFAPAVLQWGMIVVLTLWIAFQVSALYINYVYELDDIPSTRRFLLQYALGSRYETVHIRDGTVIAEDTNKFIARVGGPGRMQIDYDSVVVNETIDGAHNIVGQTSDRQRNLLCLYPFERMRITLPTSDQYMNISLDHKTREGIPIGMRNIEVRYNIFRGNQTPTLENPVVFDPDAIRDLVYNWGHTVGLRLINLVQFQLRVRLLERTFTELFAVISSPDRIIIKQNEIELRELAIQQGGIELNPINVAGIPPPHSRYEVTKLFFDISKSPVEIQW